MHTPTFVIIENKTFSSMRMPTRISWSSRGHMAGKRIRKECIHPSESKKTKREVSEDDLENMFSLLSHSGTLEAGKLFSMN